MIKYDDTVSSQTTGQPIYGAQVTVLNAQGLQATIYSDEAGTIPLSQPILTDQSGYFSFYIDDGRYNVVVMAGQAEIARTNITMVDTLGIKQRALLVPVNEDGGTIAPADARKGMVLAFDATTGAPSAVLPNEFAGPTGPANSTYTSLTALKAAPQSNRSYILADGTNSPVTYAYVAGDFTGRADDVNVVKLDAVPLTTGALVRQGADSVSYDARRTVRARLDLTVYATDARFGGGAVGNGVADDYAAIQAALDFVQAAGGGTVIAPLRHRISKGLKIGTYTRLQGPNPVRFPFNAGNPTAPAIVADFADPMQWVIDCDSRLNGQPLGYADFYTGALPNGAIYDCGVRDLLVTSTGALPFGGIRMAGVPGSTVKDVGVHRVGCGLLVNCCFGGEYSVHCLFAYYGFVGWDDFNGNSVQGYVARDGSYSGDVPANYRLKPMVTLGGSLTAEPYRMASSAHTARDVGIMCGSLGSTSNNNRFDVVVERAQTAHFLLYAYSTSFTKDYVEGSANQMRTVFAGAQSSVVLQVNHSYGTATGNFIDAGRGFDIDVNCNGSLSLASFGSVALLTDTRVTLRTITIDQFGPTPPQFNVLYEQVGNFKDLALQNGWANAGQYITPAYRREGTSRRVVFQGAVAGGATGSVIAQLPPGYRPYMLTPFAGFDVDAAGQLIARAGTAIFLTGASFEATG